VWKLTFRVHNAHKIFSVDTQSEENARMEIGVFSLLMNQPTPLSHLPRQMPWGGNFISSTVLGGLCFCDALQGFQGTNENPFGTGNEMNLFSRGVSSPLGTASLFCATCHGQGGHTAISYQQYLGWCVLVSLMKRGGPGGGRTHASHVMTSITPTRPHRPTYWQRNVLRGSESISAC